MRVRALGLAALASLAGCEGQSSQERAVAAPTATPAAAPSLASGAVGPVCAADETPIFACAFEDAKRVAVCGTGPGKAQYRFGGERAELVLEGGERAHVMYSGGGESQLAFTNGDTRYIVFSRMVRTGFDEEGNKPATSDGVVVERGGKFLAIRTCDDPNVKPVDLNAAERFLAAGKASGGMELFTEETIRADPPGDE